MMYLLTAIWGLLENEIPFFYKDSGNLEGGQLAKHRRPFLGECHWITDDCLQGKRGIKNCKTFAAIQNTGSPPLTWFSNNTVF